MQKWGCHIFGFPRLTRSPVRLPEPQHVGCSGHSTRVTISAYLPVLLIPLFRHGPCLDSPESATPRHNRYFLSICPPARPPTELSCLQSACFGPHLEAPDLPVLAAVIRLSNTQSTVPVPRSRLRKPRRPSPRPWNPGAIPIPTLSRLSSTSPRRCCGDHVDSLSRACKVSQCLT